MKRMSFALVANIPKRRKRALDNCVMHVDDPFLLSRFLIMMDFNFSSVEKVRAACSRKSLRISH